MQHPSFFLSTEIELRTAGQWISEEKMIPFDVLSVLDKLLTNRAGCLSSSFLLLLYPYTETKDWEFARQLKCRMNKKAWLLSFSKTHRFISGHTRRPQLSLKSTMPIR